MDALINEDLSEGNIINYKFSVKLAGVIGLNQINKSSSIWSIY